MFWMDVQVLLQVKYDMSIFMKVKHKQNQKDMVIHAIEKVLLSFLLDGFQCKIPHHCYLVLEITKITKIKKLHGLWLKGISFDL